MRSTLHNFCYITTETRAKLFIVLLYLAFFLVLPPAVKAQQLWVNKYEKGVVVSAERLAGKAGIEMLKKGGNAVDAAVAVNFALAVTYPQAGNIGGGGFMVIHLSDGRNVSLDFRETAPQQATPDMFLDQRGNVNTTLAQQSILASGVPGTVHGMLSALERYGRLPLDIVLQPAIKLAKNGYPLSAYQAQVLNRFRKHFEQFKASERYFTKSNNTSYKTGDLFVQRDLAKTLQRIASFGLYGFYSGPTADMIVSAMEKHGGIITHSDLKSYESRWREPVTTKFDEYKLVMMPPPSSGGITITQILNMVTGHNLKSLGFNSADYIHLLAEAMKRAYADRNYFLADPDFVDIPAEKLTSQNYGNKRMENFSWDQKTESQQIKHGKITAFNESYETTHYSVIDKEGNAVSVTTTLNSLFGTKIAVSEAGFLLNNEMDDFTAKPGTPNQFGLIQGKANRIQPKKRMLSSMTPTIVTRSDSVKMILGAAGGPRIITTVLQNFLNLTVFGMNAKQAVSAPRFHHQWLPDILYTEPQAITEDTKKLLLQKGHKIKEISNIGRSHIIFLDDNNYIYGGADPRGNGKVIGY